MRKILALIVALLMVLPFAVACTNKPADVDATTPPIEVVNNQPTKAPDEPTVDVPEVTYERADDEEIYELQLGNLAEKYAAAKAELDLTKRYAMFAEIEAEFLDAALMFPTSTQGGAYSISRVAYHTVPFVNWGNDDDRWKGVILSDELITKEEREELKEAWNKALVGEGEYDPAAILEAHGHTIQKNYIVTFATAPATLDWLGTSMQSDTEITVNCVDGLVEYNNLGQMKPALAESWEASEDGKTYTFHIRHGVYWYTSEGAQYAEVTANDFEAGFRHMLDAKEGLEWLVDGVVVGATEYLEGGSWDDVAYKATDDYTLVVELTDALPYFPTMLTYSIFLPLCKSFYEAQGGVYGAEELTAARADTNTYKYGKSEDVASQVYCGPFLLQKLQKDSEILVVKNENYYKPEEQKLDSIQWVYDNGENPDASYNEVLNGRYAGISLTAASGLLDKAKTDGTFDKYAYISETTSTTYLGGLNLNRGTFELPSGAMKSPKTEQQKIDTATAMQNKNFRLSIMYSFDKATWNAVTRGEDLKLTSLRNMYTMPTFVTLPEDYTDENGMTFPAGTMYGDIVQYYLKQFGSPVDVTDATNGWYHPEEAKAALEAAKTELGDTVTWPIYIDIEYYSASDNNTAQANAVKKSIEDVLGAENVVVNLIEATTSEDFYASGYRAANGEAGNFDLFTGSGWGPDYGDPSTYLDTFLSEGGYMLKILGLF